MISNFRINRLVWLLLGAIVILLLMYQLKSALLPFIIGGALVYILDPFVTWLERRIPWMSDRPELKRVVFIAIIFIVAAILAIIALIAGIIATVNQVQAFIGDLPNLIEAARVTFESVSTEFVIDIPPELNSLVQSATQNIGNLVVEAGKRVASSTLGVLSQTVSLLLGLAMVPLILFYVLKDKGKIIEGALNTLTPGPRRHTENVLSILDDVFGSYIRGQLLLGLVVGLVVFVGLFLMSLLFAPNMTPYTPVLGIVAGVTELIPVIGPWLGAIPGIIVTLALAPHMIVPVILLYILVQLLENSLLVPRIQSDSLNLHPVMIIAALLVGSELAGLWGIILGPPLAAAARSVLLYFLSVWRTEVEDRVAETQPVDAPDEAPPSELSDEAAPSGEPARD